jgi:hypothetical protein
MTKSTKNIIRALVYYSGPVILVDFEIIPTVSRLLEARFFGGWEQISGGRAPFLARGSGIS